MSTYVLVHGSWHGAWCWYKVVPRLEQAGHTVIAPDLPSLGRDKTPVSKVSLKTWTDSICQVLDAQDEPCILVGHSRGGIVISQAAEQRPQKVCALVYLAAFLLRAGESVEQVLREDGTSLILPNLVISADHRSVAIRERAVKEVFYGECAAQDVALARLLLAPEALAPLATPVRVTEANFGRVPRVYIECRRDRAVPPTVQKRMYTALPCQKVVSMDSDHSPFFSSPEDLVGHLLALPPTQHRALSA
jgi:pimeloyl-ACP methyl ester carboxylesterase